MTDDGFAWLEQDHRDIEEQFQTFLRDNEEAALDPALRRYVDDGDDLAERAEQELDADGLIGYALEPSCPRSSE